MGIAAILKNSQPILRIQPSCVYFSVRMRLARDGALAPKD